jgi:hypothetical protein
MPPADVFVSYARKDDALVYPVASRLRAHGVQLWIDKLDILPGDCFRTEITRAIDQCKLFVFMGSQQSLASEFCFKEMAYATTAKRPLVTLWLCPPCALPGRFALELGPYHQIVLADRPAELWLPELLRALTRHSAGHRGGDPKRGQEFARNRHLLPVLKSAMDAAAQRRDWQAVLTGALDYLHIMPDDPNILTAAGTAAKWLNHEQNQLFARIVKSRDARDWTDFLARYPSGPAADHARRKIAHLLDAGELERYLRICTRSAEDDRRATGWRIAAVVCLFRLGQYQQGGALLEEVRAVAPRHAEMLFFRVVAALHASRGGGLDRDRLRSVANHLQVVMAAAPDCGLPDLLAGLVARDFCEPFGLACPLGDSLTLLGRAATRGLTADDLRDFHALVGRPTGPAGAGPELQPETPAEAAPAEAGWAQEPAPLHGTPRTPVRPGARLPWWGIGAVASLAIVVVVVAGAFLVFFRPGATPAGDDRPAAGPKIALTVGDFVEMRDKTAQSGNRVEVIQVDGNKYQIRRTTVLQGNEIDSRQQVLDLGATLDPVQRQNWDQKMRAGMKGIWKGLRNTHARKTWRYQGQDYPCDVYTWNGELGGAAFEQVFWLVDDQYFTAVMEGFPLVRHESRSAGVDQITMEVTAVRFAARR